MSESVLNDTESRALHTIRECLAQLTVESQRLVLEELLTNRCRKCLDYDSNGSFWCCYDSRG